MHLERRIIIIISVLVLLGLIEIVISIGTHFILKNKDNMNVMNKLQEINDNIIDNLKDILYRTERSISRAATFFNIHGIYISQSQYNELLQNEVNIILKSIESFIWVLKLPDVNKTTYQNYCRENIFENCTISEYNVTNQSFVPVRYKPYYYPLVLATPPLSTGNMLIGFDLTSHPATNVFIELSLKNINTTGSFRVGLSKKDLNNPNSYGILLSKPSFFNNSNPKLSEINGLMWAIIHLNDLATYAIQSMDVERNDIEMLIFDVSEDGFANNKTNNISLLYKENSEQYKYIWFDNDVLIPANMFKNSLNIVYRNWTIYFKFSNAFTNKFRTDLPVSIPCIIMTISLLINIIIILLYNIYDSIIKRAQSEKDKNIIATQMLGYVNHEVRNPLNVIKGLITLILDNLNGIDKIQNGENEDSISINKELFETMISDLATVTGACDLLEHIVTDILDIRKLESGKMILDNKIVLISDFIIDLVKTISQKIDEKQSVELKLEYDENSKIIIDPYRLKQILLNYLTNAIKYTDNGNIILRIEKIDDVIRFSVIDTGRGIKDDAKDRIFQPFNQVNPEDAARYGGIGLGLYLCKMLATSMGGSVGFISEYGSGSTFWVEFSEEMLSPDNVPDDVNINIIL